MSWRPCGFGFCGASSSQIGYMLGWANSKTGIWACVTAELVSLATLLHTPHQGQLSRTALVREGRDQITRVPKLSGVEPALLCCPGKVQGPLSCLSWEGVGPALPCCSSGTGPALQHSCPQGRLPSTHSFRASSTVLPRDSPFLLT